MHFNCASEYAVVNVHLWMQLLLCICKCSSICASVHKSEIELHCEVDVEYVHVSCLFPDLPVWWLVKNFTVKLTMNVFMWPVVVSLWSTRDQPVTCCGQFVVNLWPACDLLWSICGQPVTSMKWWHGHALHCADNNECFHVSCTHVEPPVLRSEIKSYNWSIKGARQAREAMAREAKLAKGPGWPRWSG
jgi:hypothetical protein